MGKKELGEFEFKKICERKPQCYCPPRHILNHELANHPEYLSRYLIELGERKVKDDIKKIMKNNKKEGNMILALTNYLIGDKHDEYRLQI